MSQDRAVAQSKVVKARQSALEPIVNHAVIGWGGI
jgi:hypothetical protein